MAVVPATRARACTCSPRGTVVRRAARAPTSSSGPATSSASSRCSSTTAPGSRASRASPARVAASIPREDFLALRRDRAELRAAPPARARAAADARPRGRLSRSLGDVTAAPVRLAPSPTTQGGTRGRRKAWRGSRRSRGSPPCFCGSSGSSSSESDSPDDDAPGTELAAYFADHEAEIFIGAGLFCLGSALFIWFMASLAAHFRRRRRRRASGDGDGVRRRGHGCHPRARSPPECRRRPRRRQRGSGAVARGGRDAVGARRRVLRRRRAARGRACWARRR